MKKSELETLIYDLKAKKERTEEEAGQYRDLWHELTGAAGELEVLIWKLEGKLK